MSMTFDDAEGLPVIAADSAETIGEIKGFIVDSTATRIESIHVSGRGKRAEVVEWSSIRSFGEDAVIAVMAEASHRVSSDHETQAVKGKIVARDTRVLDTNGFEQGTVNNVMFDPSSGELTGVLTTEGRVGGESLKALGSYALVIQAD